MSDERGAPVNQQQDVGSESEIVQTHVTAVVIHRAEDRQKVRDAFEDWNVRAGVDAIYDHANFHERPLNLGADSS